MRLGVDDHPLSIELESKYQATNGTKESGMSHYPLRALRKCNQIRRGEYPCSSARYRADQHGLEQT